VGGKRLVAEFASEDEASIAMNGGALTGATQRRKEEAARPKSEKKEEPEKAKPKRERDGKIKKEEEPKKKPKTLDELFRSTKAEPRIYWLPASVESPVKASDQGEEV